MISAARFTFIVEGSWKNMYFNQKMTWPPATYDVISRTHSNWPSLNLSKKKVPKGWTNSYWKRQVLMFYPLGKNSKKPYGGSGIHPPPPPLLVRPIVLISLLSIPCEILSLIGPQKNKCFLNYLSWDQGLFGYISLNLKISRLKWHRFETSRGQITE